MLTRRITIVLSLIVIVVGIILIASIAIKIPTTIDDIQKHPDRYIDKKVIVIGRRGDLVRDPTSTRTTYGDLKGFWIHQNAHSIFPSGIFVNYIGDPPSYQAKDKWGRTIAGVEVKVTGIVRHKPGFFYIEGESWEYKR